MSKNCWSKRARREFIRELTDAGYTPRKQSGGSHTVYVKVGCNPITINKNLNLMVYKRLRKEVVR